MIQRLPLVTRTIVALIASRSESIKLRQTTPSLLIKLLQEVRFLDGCASRRDGADQRERIVVDHQIVGQDVVE